MNLKKILKITALIFLIIILGVSIWIYVGFNVPVDNSDDQIIDITIEEGASTEKIASTLKDAGLIRSDLAFKIKAFFSPNLLPGIYYISPNMSISQIISELNGGNIAEVTVTIPEGYSSWQIADEVSNQIDLDKDTLQELAEENEGYLFPDTYRFALKSEPQDIIDKMMGNFYAKTAELNLTRDELILASIIEREAINDEERSDIAGVYTNRIFYGMKLDADPTVQYAKGSWDPITQADYQSVDSKYNTYINKGLPPGSICNPGLESILAAQSPTDHDYFYFFHTDDGQTIYSMTFDEHQAKLNSL